ncbi:hypothetical protein OAN61_00340 [bacterium]|nr:hypothetical protein [bacterium]
MLQAFLGLSFSATIQQATRSMPKHALITSIPPLLLVLSGAIAGALGTTLTANTSLFVGLIAFSVVALLFLVTQELLLGAVENTGGESITWVNVCFFLGVLTVIMVERIFE